MTGGVVGPEEVALRQAAEVGNPIFVLTCARSGSTLLRLLLDAHPEIDCPPETNVVTLAHQLLTSRSALNVPESTREAQRRKGIIESRRLIRRLMDERTRAAGKRRWCDKSLPTAEFAELTFELFPRAQFICLYRHPLDLIVSAVEANPWGFVGYGFEPFIAKSPTNFVHALMEYWLAHTSMIRGFEITHPRRCFRLQYEAFVQDPKATWEALCDFLGVAQAPDALDQLFETQRSGFGPADYKVWYSSSINDESIGRGADIPLKLIGPALLNAVNELLPHLEYPVIDSRWGEHARESLGASSRAHQQLDHCDRCDSINQTIIEPLSDRLQRWDVLRGLPVIGEVELAFDDGCASCAQWTVDPRAGTVRRGPSETPALRVMTDSGLLADASKLGVLLRNGKIRMVANYPENVENPPTYEVYSLVGVLFGTSEGAAHRLVAGVELLSASQR